MRKEISRHLHGSAKKTAKKNVRIADLSPGRSYVRQITVHYEDRTASKTVPKKFRSSRRKPISLSQSI